MAGTPKISDRKIKNMGLAKLEHACSEIANKVMSKEHPLSLLKVDEDAMHHLAQMSHEEFKSHMLDTLKLNASKLSHRMAREMDDIPTRHLPMALAIILDRIRDIEGEPSQRVEVVKKGLTDKQYNELLDRLPKEKLVEIKDINDAKFK